MKDLFKDKKIIDISPTISHQTSVFPGDTAFSLNTSLDFSKGDQLKLSSMNTTLHIGAHADAPNHYNCDGDGIHKRDLNYYIGPCQVLDITCLNPGERIKPHHLNIYDIKAPRVLFKTLSFEVHNKWTPDFNSLSPDLIDLLGQRGVLLIGIDTPSVDPHDSKSLESHNAIYKHNMAILEGLTLTNVSPDHYTLIAPPLKIKEADASPVRALLIQ